MLSLRAAATSGVQQIDGSLMWALKQLRQRIVEGKPVVLDVLDQRPPVVLFTDGSYEPESDKTPAEVGGILFDPADDARLCFGGHVPEWLMSRWMENGRTQVIAQAELLPVLIAFKAFPERLRGRMALIFLDNEGARAGLVAASSSVESNSELIHAITQLEDQLLVKAWYSRVPTASNCADPPSRGKMRETIQRFGAKEVSMPVPIPEWITAPE